MMMVIMMMMMMISMMMLPAPPPSLYAVDLLFALSIDVQDYSSSFKGSLPRAPQV